jgi:uncharacterized protein YbbC (DUF1343 family)
MKLGIEVLLENKKSLQQLKRKRVALVCHPASVDQKLEHSFDLLHEKIGLSAAFGPQHGVKGDKQYNMIESEDVIDPVHQIPIYSLYGRVRRPTREMMESFDVIIFDLQDLGCRIYTFITTLLYIMDECAKHGKTLIVLDRPNPAGREIEGLRLVPGHESFVGAAPIPMRHGLTVGEMAVYYKMHFSLNLEMTVVRMKGYNPSRAPGFGWPQELAWVNPSPNAQTLNMARAYSGTVMIEGTHLSEGRGTTRALEVIGAPDLDYGKILQQMRKKAPQWMKGALLRECFFEPTFYKHQGKLCHGFQFHTDFGGYKPKDFKPYRVVAMMMKVIRELYPNHQIYRDFAYEYVTDRLAFDVINGGPALRKWIENPKATPKDLEKLLKSDENSWKKEMKKYLLYPA